MHTIFAANLVEDVDAMWKNFAQTKCQDIICRKRVRVGSESG